MTSGISPTNTLRYVCSHSKQPAGPVGDALDAAGKLWLCSTLDGVDTPRNRAPASQGA
jgi:hypothetical protein